MACQSEPFACQRYGCCTPTCCPSQPICAVPCPMPSPPLPPHPLPPSAAFQAASPSNQTLLANTTSQLLFQYSTAGNAAVYTPYTSIFQAPTAGMYLFSMNIAWNSTTTGAALTLSLNVAGLNVLSTTNFNTLINQSDAFLTGIVALAAGQTVTVQALCSAGATVLGQVPSPTSLSWFSGTRV